MNPLLRRPVSNPRGVSTTVVGAGLPANTVAPATVNGGWKLASRAGPFAGEPAPTTACVQPTRCVHHRGRCGFTREYGGGGNGERLVKLASRAGPFAGEPAPTRRPAPNPRRVTTTVVGAGLPANTVAPATVNGGWKLASRPGPFAGEPAPTRRPAHNHRPVSTPDQ